VAEGVETAEDAAILRELGCDEAQGYHYSKPVAAADFKKW
jgi:EAL domain-containing protein (putative c-di-GMP-specific phosphodiesterase class I)